MRSKQDLLSIFNVGGGRRSEGHENWETEVTETERELWIRNILLPT